jgi:ABC-type nitrate/sulfonate/bicarbonate transport system permease component
VTIALDARVAGRRQTGALLARTGRGAVFVVASVLVILAIWEGFLWLFVDKAIAVHPADVWRYLVTGPKAGDHRHALVFGSKAVDGADYGLVLTLKDAGTGYVLGLAAAVFVSAVFALYRPVERTFMPVAIVLRSIPVIAMTPLITLLFGHSLAAVAVMAAIVTFFPTLVNMVLGFRSAPPQSTDLLASYGAGRLTAFRKVQVPFALPAFFASARITVPLAIVGALLAEALATGKGIGYGLLYAQNQFFFVRLWTMTVVVTAASAVLYGVVGLMETAVLARFAPSEHR